MKPTTQQFLKDISASENRILNNWSLIFLPIKIK